MLAITRRQVIKELLQQNKSVTISELASRLNVTKETIRRDLSSMEKDNELIRTHGGAYVPDVIERGMDVSERQVLKTAEKEAIAEKCSELIRPGDIIYLDDSTTDWFIARKAADKQITLVTPSLEIANILKNSSSVRLFLIGGEFSEKSMSFTGPSAIRNLEQYYVDKAFISPWSVHRDFGLTDASEEAAIMHRVALQHAKQKILVADFTKLDRHSFCTVAPICDVDVIVMEKEFSPEWKECLRANQVRYY